MYMPDCIDAVVQLMEAPAEKLTQRVYNVTGFSFTPKQVAESIQKQLPSFQAAYQPDYRQAIADSWPRSLDDSRARADWGWAPKFNLDSMSVDMLKELTQKYKPTKKTTSKK
jgi:threonine 3-dehydrogenase